MLFSISGCSRMLGTRHSQRARIDLFFDAQLVGAEAHHFNIEIIVGKAQLVAQRNIGVVILEQRAQNIGQFHRHFARQLRLHAHQRGNGVERIEKKMRIDLALQRIEPSFKQQPLLFFELHLDAQGIPHLDGNADHDRRAETGPVPAARACRRAAQTAGAEKRGPASRG